MNSNHSVSNKIPAWARDPVYFPVFWIPFFLLAVLGVEVEGSLVFDLEAAAPIASWETPWLYAATLVASILFPFLLSFDKNVHFYKKWRPLFSATFIVAFFFIVWDIVFTARGVWGFNEAYYLGATMAGLPIEEWLWFFIIPYCCIFIYECLNFYVHKDPLIKLADPISFSLAVVFAVVALVHYDHMYTLLAWGSASMITWYHLLTGTTAQRSRFLAAWVVSILPFYIVNGILTGGYTEEPIVVYSSTEFTGIRWGTIPIDDGIYLYAMLLWIVMLFERFRSK